MKCGFFSARPSELGAICTDLVLFPGLSASPVTMMAALVVSITVCIIACVWPSVLLWLS